MIERFELFTTTITQIYKNLQRVKMIEMADLKLRGTHVMCLFQLHRHPEGLTVTQLSTLCGEDKAATSRTVSELIQKELITTDSSKKYRSPIFLTTKGINIANQIDIQATQAVQTIGFDLTDEERDIFYRALTNISNNLKNYLND